MEVKTKGKDLNIDGNVEEGKGKLKLGGNIVLAGFSLEPVEMIVVKKIIGNHAKKLGEKVKYKEIKITLKKTEKAKSFLHEINVKVRTDKGILTADSIDNNIYTALAGALNKLFNQADHKERTQRQTE